MNLKVKNIRECNSNDIFYHESEFAPPPTGEDIKVDYEVDGKKISAIYFIEYGAIGIGKGEGALYRVCPAEGWESF